MDLGSAGLSQQPFPNHGTPSVTVKYASMTAAQEVLKSTCEHPNGLSILQGPALSGKKTLVANFVDTLDDDYSVAVINGKGLDTTGLLVSILRQFGYELDLSSTNELLGLVRVFALQQAASNGAPVLIIENTHELNPSGMRTLCDLSELRHKDTSALKFVLVSDRSLQAIMKAHAMRPMADRLVHNFHLRPMSRSETQQYLHSKLRAAGSEDPDRLFPDAICHDIWRASGGWPGMVDRISLLAVAHAESPPVPATAIKYPLIPVGTWSDTGEPGIAPDDIFPPDPPRLVVTNNGSVMKALTMDDSRVLIGRSEQNEISINSRFVSRHHALIVRNGSSTYLMDLNSTNGTFVNSKRVSNYVLINDDVITIGHHRIKFYDQRAIARSELDGSEFTDTTVMKSLDDMRNLLTKRNTNLLDGYSEEELPTIQT